MQVMTFPLKTWTSPSKAVGAHGAFVWEVTDRLLEDGRLGIEGISTTSAGAMNVTLPSIF
ncbi:MAG: hypothetical protein JO358_03655 [Alphaproteobacteria bacterium]|nr:hypothetical protein [Acetobacteraceae bacterium]MBV8334541.1 hypothetical protein [Alphaproteobacteria bacterium]